MRNIAHFMGKRGVTAVLLAVFAFVPIGAYAQTTDISALIAQLQAQIVALQQQIKSLQAQQQPAEQFCHTFHQNLRIDNRGSEVTALQTALQKEGFAFNAGELAGETNYDYGTFGESTAAAVTGFQEKYRDEILTPNGLKYGTGYVGKSTRAKLNQLYGCGRITTQPVPVPIPQPIPLPKPIPVPGNQPPVISGVSGPTTLNVNQVGIWSVSAHDPESGTLSYRVVWGDETPSVSGGGGMAPSVPFSAQTATFTHSYAAGGSYTPIFYVSDNTGQQAKTSISIVVGNISNEWMKEQVKCVFNGSNTEQRCYTSGLEGVLECSGVNSCVVDNVPGWRGEQITWKSSCGGYAYTTVDGQAEHATFQCGTSTQPSITFTSPNGGETLQRGSNYSITWTQPITLLSPLTYDISLIPYQAPCPPGTACILSMPMPYTIVKNYYNKETGNGVYPWVVGNVQESYYTVPDGSYTIQVCQSGTSICDQSDSYFKIVTQPAKPSITYDIPGRLIAFDLPSGWSVNESRSNRAMYGVDAAFDVNGRQGIEGLSYDAVGDESGPGVTLDQWVAGHFPNVLSSTQSSYSGRPARVVTLAGGLDVSKRVVMIVGNTVLTFVTDGRMLTSGLLDTVRYTGF